MTSRMVQMTEPWFWRETTYAAQGAAIILSPLGALYDIGQRIKAAVTTPVRSAAPVICIGNATLGGAGKTPFALALYQLLATHFTNHPAMGDVIDDRDGGDADFSADHDRNIAFLTRGFGGALIGPECVNPSHHNAAMVGDEPLLLAQKAPTIVSRRRPAGAAFAAAQGAALIIMDDGYQNPSLEKDVSILIINSNDPDGNGYVFPAGPLREPLTRAAARADIAILTGDGAASIDFSGPTFRASVAPTGAPPDTPLFAFCGIGAPQRFFDTLQKLDANILDTISFPDHHMYTAREISALKKRAGAHGASLITTEKDYARLDDTQRDGVQFLPVQMQVDAPDALIATILDCIAKRRPEWRRTDILSGAADDA